MTVSELNQPRWRPLSAPQNKRHVFRCAFGTLLLAVRLRCQLLYEVKLVKKNLPKWKSGAAALEKLQAVRTLRWNRCQFSHRVGVLARFWMRHLRGLFWNKITMILHPLETLLFESSLLAASFYIFLPFSFPFIAQYSPTECFTNPGDLFLMSIFKRAHKIHLERGGLGRWLDEASWAAPRLTSCGFSSWHFTSAVVFDVTLAKVSHE